MHDFHVHLDYLGSCNHIASVLFRVESAVEIRATCTEILCKWNAPKGSVRKPGKWNDALLSSGEHSQKVGKKENRKNGVKRKNFNPFSLSSRGTSRYSYNF